MLGVLGLLASTACARTPINGQIDECYRPLIARATVQVDFGVGSVVSLGDGTVAVTSTNERLELYIGDLLDGKLRRHRPEKSIRVDRTRIVHVDERDLYIIGTLWDEPGIVDRLWRFDRREHEFEEVDLGLPTGAVLGAVSVHEDAGISVGWNDSRTLEPDDIHGFVSGYTADETLASTAPLGGYLPSGAMFATGRVEEGNHHVFVSSARPDGPFGGTREMLSVHAGLLSSRAVVGWYTDEVDYGKNASRVIFEHGEASGHAPEYFVFGSDHVWDPHYRYGVPEWSNSDEIDEVVGWDRRAFFVEAWRDASSQWRVNDLWGPRDYVFVLDAATRDRSFVAVAFVEAEQEGSRTEELVVYLVNRAGTLTCRSRLEPAEDIFGHDATAAISGDTIVLGQRAYDVEESGSLLVYEF